MVIANNRLLTSREDIEEFCRGYLSRDETDIVEIVKQKLGVEDERQPKHKRKRDDDDDSNNKTKWPYGHDGHRY